VGDQVKPYCSEIEFYNTTGKRKVPPSDANAKQAEGLAGVWNLIVETPFGQDIPASLTITNENGAYTGQVESEMGAGSLSSVKVEGSAFQATISFDMDGSSVVAQIEGTANGARLDGKISLPNLPSLPFNGSRQS
jgi:hypothetical protein